MDQHSQKTCATLDYIYHIFDKFAVSMALCRGSIRDLNLHVLLKLRDAVGEYLEQRTCKEYLKNLIGQLEKEKGNDFSNLRIQFHVQMSESWDSNNIESRFLIPSPSKKAYGKLGLSTYMLCTHPINLCWKQWTTALAWWASNTPPPYLCI